LLDEYEVEAILYASAPDSISEVRDTDGPLIVTLSKILSMIDKSIPRPFFGTNEKRNSWHAEGGQRLASIIPLNWLSVEARASEGTRAREI
jgi:hypothetical protein